MDPKYYGLVEMGFTLALVFVFGGWQLWSINREQARDRADKASRDLAGHTVGEHPLDDR